MQKHKQIPTINRDAPLVTRLLPIVMIGADRVLDKKSKLYLRLLCRLVDKSFNEYSIAKEYIDEEIKTKNRLAYFFSIIDHLENCINAIHRAAKTFKTLTKGKNKLLEFISKDTLEKIRKYDTFTKYKNSIRNRVEHIDDDIQEGKIQGRLFLQVDDSYEKICINMKYLALNDLVSMIEDYHRAILEICSNLPNKS